MRNFENAYIGKKLKREYFGINIKIGKGKTEEPAEGTWFRTAYHLAVWNGKGYTIRHVFCEPDID